MEAETAATTKSWKKEQKLLRASGRSPLISEFWTPEL
jgi:hypothetical protein